MIIIESLTPFSSYGTSASLTDLTTLPLPCSRSGAMTFIALPTASSGTATMIIESPTSKCSNANPTFNAPHTTMLTEYLGSTTSALTLACASGGSPGTVIFETPTSGSVFAGGSCSGSYTTI